MLFEQLLELFPCQEAPLHHAESLILQASVLGQQDSGQRCSCAMQALELLSSMQVGTWHCCICHRHLCWHVAARSCYRMALCAACTSIARLNMVVSCTESACLQGTAPGPGHLPLLLHAAAESQAALAQADMCMALASGPSCQHHPGEHAEQSAQLWQQLADAISADELQDSSSSEALRRTGFMATLSELVCLTALKGAAVPRSPALTPAALPSPCT